MLRPLAVAGLLALVVGAPAVPVGGTGAAGGVAAARGGAVLGPTSVVVYRAPVTVTLRVLRPFDPPRTLYGAGHRGVDLDAGSSRMVVAAAAGVVAFAGSVAGRGVVVLAHADGISTEYEPVRPLVPAGSTVRAGQPIGIVSGRHGSCTVPTCLHWGARRGAVYLDPLGLLRPLGPVRLLPWTRAPP